MNDLLTTFLQLTKGVRIQLIAAFVLVLIVTVIFIASFRQPNSNTEITTTEKSYPNVTPQVFNNNSAEETGVLVVTANVEGVWVYIDPPQDTHAEASLQKSESKPVPPQYPPFKIETLPVGTHRLIAAKPDYVSEDMTIEIKRGEVTRVHFTLNPVAKQ